MKSKNDQVLYAATMGLREMLEICGAQVFTEKDKGLIVKTKTDAPTKYVKDAAQGLLDELAGRRLMLIYEHY